MPKLLFFGAARRVIVDSATTQISLIDLFIGLDVNHPVGTLPPPGATLPFEWGVAVVFRFDEASEVGMPHRGRFALTLPNEQLIVLTEFTVIPPEAGLIMTQTVRNDSIRIDVPGDCLLSISFFDEAEQKWHILGETALRLRYSPKAQ